MNEFERERRMMVDGQIRTADVTNRRLQAALLTVPREIFLPRAKHAQAYADADYVILQRVFSSNSHRSRMMQAAHFGFLATQV